MSDTPTPRTDAMCFKSECYQNYVSAHFARRLERELAAALARVRELEEENEFMRKKLQKIEYGA